MSGKHLALLFSLGCASDVPPPDHEGNGEDDDDGEGEGEGEWEGFLLGEAVACEEPATSPSWTEVGGLWGLVGATDPAGFHGAGGMLAVTDFDRDGALDIVTVFPNEVHFQRREADAFAVVSTLAPLSPYILTTADLDADGQEEILLGGVRPQRLAWNEGAISTSYLLGDAPQSVPVQGLFGDDLDSDGQMDLFAMVNAPELPDFILRGAEDGVFEADYAMISETLGAGRGFDAQWFDWDGDLDRDLYLVNDHGHESGPNVLFENDGGTLVDASADCFCGVAMSGMGVSVADYDRDGDPDLFVTASASLLLLQQVSDGGYADVSQTWGIPAMTLRQMGWGSAWLDYDNDGQADIALMRGDLWDENSGAEMTYEDTPQLLRQDEGRFVDVAPDLGMDPAGSWRSVVAVDLNGDGVVDPIFTDVLKRPQLFLSDACTDAGWLEVVGPIGARVEVDAGGHTQTAWIDTHTGMGATQPPLVHFGLGEAQTVDQLRVTLPDGTQLSTPAFEGRRTVRVEWP